MSTRRGPWYDDVREQEEPPLCWCGKGYQGHDAAHANQPVTTAESDNAERMDDTEAVMLLSQGKHTEGSFDAYDLLRWAAEQLREHADRITGMEFANAAPMVGANLWLADYIERLHGDLSAAGQADPPENHIEGALNTDYEHALERFYEDIDKALYPFDYAAEKARAEQESPTE